MFNIGNEELEPLRKVENVVDHKQEFDIVHTYPKSGVKEICTVTRSKTTSGEPTWMIGYYKTSIDSIHIAVVSSKVLPTIVLVNQIVEPLTP